ncbi:beta-lactamase family protein [bacterium]|nr:beta-lactamase family protein [bacterium]
MTNRRQFIRLLAGGLTLAGCGGSNPPALTSGGGSIIADPAALSARLEKDVLVIQNEGHIPGLNVGIWTPQSSWVRSLGLATLAPDRPLAIEDIFSWRSVTKSMTVTVVLQLLAEAQIGLDTSVNRFLNGVPGENSVTIRSLADMSSGLFEYTRTQAVIDAITADPLRHYTASELVLPALAQGLHFSPGSAYEYCNTNTLLLGMLAEKLSGKPMDSLISERIFQPLGMSASAYLEGVDRPAPATLGYAFDNGTQVETRISHSALGAAGAAVGPLSDARRWAAALAGGLLVPPQFRSERLRSREAVNGPIYDTYGLGLGQVQGWLGHTGEGIGYAVALFGEPLSDSQIVVLCNGSNVHDQPLRLVRRFLVTLGWPIAPPSNARP